MPDYTHESACESPVCGIDEVGRGPWAGPVVACAVILDPSRIPDGLNDSKKLTAARRETLHDHLVVHAHVGLGWATREEIDSHNILRASLLAMRRAVDALPIAPRFALVDGNRLPDLSCPARAVIGGDAACLSIAAASVVAKVVRDRHMVKLARTYPGYGWETNAGYGTGTHQEGLRRHGITPEHRRSFAPIRLLLEAA